MITIVETIELKKKLLEVCLKTLHSFTQQVKSRINTIRKQDNSSKLENKNNLNILTSPTKNLQVKHLNEDLDLATKDMRVLKYLSKHHEEEHSKVELGAVVVTHRHTFLIATDLQRLEVDGQQFIAISTQSQLFKSMRGKKAGEKFVHKDLWYKILDVF